MLISKVVCDDLATSYKIWSDPVTPEFEGRRSTPFINQQFGYVRLAAILLDLAGISTEFCGAISTHFLFHCCSLGDVTATHFLQNKVSKIYVDLYSASSSIQISSTDFTVPQKVEGLSFSTLSALFYRNWGISKNKSSK